MKFSLKDLLWSVTLASGGLGTLMFCLNENYSIGPRLLLLLFVCPLFGAAIGKLLNRTKDYVYLILMAEFIVVIVGAFLIVIR